MFKLSEASLRRGYDAILYHGYSDFFPSPPEFDAVKKGWGELRPKLAAIDLEEYKPFKPLFTFAPKSKINLRPVALLHPVDLILYTSLVASLVKCISEQRIPACELTVFSFRRESAPPGALYAPIPSHAEFEDEKLRMVSQNPDGFVGFADIADFYPRLYQHKIRGALDGCVAGHPELTAYPGVIERFLRGLNPDNLSYGIPIGPAASRPLAEAALLDVDNALLSFDVSFIRYIDDFVFFAETRAKVEWALRTLGELLDKQHGLSLHAAKTKVMRCAKVIELAHQTPSSEDSVEERLAALIEKRFYDDDWRTLDDLDEDEKQALSALDLQEILEEALDEDETDYKKVAFILARLASLDRADLADIVVSHLARLYPVSHAINVFFRDAGDLSPQARRKCARKLLAPILASGDEQAPEFYSIWILDLFRISASWNEAATLARIFRQTQSQAVRRYAALAQSTNGTRSGALSYKDAFHSAEPLARTAMLLASRKLGQDERGHWVRRLGLPWFDDFLLKYE